MARLAVSLCFVALGVGAAHGREADDGRFAVALRDGPLLSAKEANGAPEIRRDPAVFDAAMLDPDPATPASDSKVTLSGGEALALAQQLYDAGNLKGALEILAALHENPSDAVDQTEVTFLLGMIAMQTGEYATAMALFRSIIDRRPDIVRVRLELARALFELKEDRAAAYHFRLALADGLPPEAEANIRRFLAAIERRKIWRINAQIGAAPDSNVSAGPKDRTVELFGLPFELDDDARQKSGIGMTTSLNAQFLPKINDNFRFEMRGGGSFSDYKNADFDDLFLFAEAGPRFAVDGLRVSTLATVSRRYFGNTGYRRTLGGKLKVDKGLTSRTILSMRFSSAQATYDLDTSRDGPVFSAGLDAMHALNRVATLQAGVGATREQTKLQELRNTQYLLNTSYRRELPYGVTVQAGPEVYYRRFDNFSPVDGVTRRDWTYGGSVFVTKRDWRVFGFAPVVSYQYLNNTSNADRFDYVRHRANIGLTRVF